MLSLTLIFLRTRRHICTEYVGYSYLPYCQIYCFCFQCLCIFVSYTGWSIWKVWTPWISCEFDYLRGPLQLVCFFAPPRCLYCHMLRTCAIVSFLFICAIKQACTCILTHYHLYPNRYRIEQELGTEIKQIPPHIDQAIYCRWFVASILLYSQWW